MDGNPKSLREALTLRASTILANYRKHCATASSSGQLILPECMKLMPLYVCCMMVSSSFEFPVRVRQLKSSRSTRYPRRSFRNISLTIFQKSDALAGGPELTVDDRAYAMLCLGSMDVKSSQVRPNSSIFSVDPLRIRRTSL